MQTLRQIKSDGNGGVLNGSLEVIHVHILLVTPLGASYMAQPGTDQYKGRIAVRETAHYTSAAAELPVQPLNHIVGSDASPVFAGEITVEQSFLNTVLNFLAASFSFMERSSSTTVLAFSLAALLLS